MLSRPILQIHLTSLPSKNTLLSIVLINSGRTPAVFDKTSLHKDDKVIVSSDVENNVFERFIKTRKLRHSMSFETKNLKNLEAVGSNQPPIELLTIENSLSDFTKDSLVEFKKEFDGLKVIVDYKCFYLIPCKADSIIKVQLEPFKISSN